MLKFFGMWLIYLLGLRTALYIYTSLQVYGKPAWKLTHSFTNQVVLAWKVWFRSGNLTIAIENLPSMSYWTHETIGLFICQVFAVFVFLSVTCWQSVPETYLIYVTWKCHQEDRHSLCSVCLCTVVGEDIFWSLAWAARLKSAGKPLPPNQTFFSMKLF